MIFYFFISIDIWWNCIWILIGYWLDIFTIPICNHLAYIFAIIQKTLKYCYIRNARVDLL